MTPAPARRVPRRDRLDGVAVAVMLVCCVLWGLQQVVVKRTLPAIPAFEQCALRSLVGAVLVLAWSTARGIPLFARDGTLLPGLAAGLLFALEFLGIYGALPLTDASRVSVFIYTAPFVVALALPRFVPSERLAPVQLLGLVAAFAALAWAFAEGFASSARIRWTGDALALAAAVFWGSTTIVIRTTRLATTSPEKTLFYQLAVSAVVAWIAAQATGGRWTPSDVPAWAWGSLVFQSAVVAFASYLAWFWLLARYPATRLSAFAFLTPVFGLAFAALLLGEAIGVRLVVALAGIAIGIWLVNAKAARTVVASEPPA